MKVAAVTITYNRLDLTKKTVESFYSKTSVDYHLFIDNGSTDGTNEWLFKTYDYIRLEKNYGIAYAFREACRHLKDYDFILKLDNDIETVTIDIVNKMIQFYVLNGMNYVCSPVDLVLDPNFKPAVFSSMELNGYDCEFTTHTGGAFQMIPQNICQRLCADYHHLKAGDYMIGRYFRKYHYKPTYLRDLEMKHIGINQSIKDYIL
jgi:glycosyltransferase involved in cell wall biosynthesis